MNFGGQELRILLEMEALTPRGYQSYLICPPGSRIAEEAMVRNIHPELIPMRNSLDPGAAFSFFRFLRRHRIDIINAHGSKDAWSAAWSARPMGIPLVRSRHVAHAIRRNRFSRLIYTRFSDAVMTTSRSIKEGLVERGIPEKRISVVPTGVNLDDFDPDRIDGSNFRHEIGVPLRAPLIGLVADLRRDKRPDLLIHAAPQVLTGLPEAHFVLAGDGEMMDACRRLAGDLNLTDRVRFTGFRRDVPQILAALDIFVFPTVNAEGISQAVLQAFAMNTPVISTQVGGVCEVAIPDLTCWGLTPGDARDLAQKILRVYGLPPQERLIRIRKARKMVRDEFSLDIMLSRMDRLYRSLLAKKTS